jgi:hypothetical protein
MIGVHGYTGIGAKSNSKTLTVIPVPEGNHHSTSIIKRSVGGHFCLYLRTLMLGKNQGAICLTWMLVQESKTRDELIGLLFNLTKRPEVEARRRILAGLAWLCCQPGWTGHRVEEEILPHLWSQLEHKVTHRIY